MNKNIRNSFTLTMVILLILQAGTCLGKTSPKEIDCGSIKVGQTKDVVIEVVNDHKAPMIVEKVSVCCGNRPPSIDIKKIMPGATARLVQHIRKVKPGPFMVTSRVHLIKPHKEVIYFNIKGIVQQPVGASVGWEGDELTVVDYKKSKIQLPQIHHTGRKLNILLRADDTIAATLSDVALSSVGQPKVEQGKQSTSILMKMIDGEPVQTCVLEPYLAKRESTGSVPKNVKRGDV